VEEVEEVVGMQVERAVEIVLHQQVNEVAVVVPALVIPAVVADDHESAAVSFASTAVPEYFTQSQNLPSEDEETMEDSPILGKRVHTLIHSNDSSTDNSPSMPRPPRKEPRFDDIAEDIEDEMAIAQETALPETPVRPTNIQSQEESPELIPYRAEVDINALPVDNNRVVVEDAAPAEDQQVDAARDLLHQMGETSDDDSDENVEQEKKTMTSGNDVSVGPSVPQDQVETQNGDADSSH